MKQNLATNKSMSCGCSHRRSNRYELTSTPQGLTPRVVSSGSATFNGVSSQLPVSPRPRTTLAQRAEYWAQSRGQVSPQRQRSALYALAPGQVRTSAAPSSNQYDGIELGESPSRSTPSPAPYYIESTGAALMRAIFNQNVDRVSDLIEERPNQEALNSALRQAAFQGLHAANPIVQALLRAGANPEAARLQARAIYEEALRNLQVYATVARRRQSSRPNQPMPM